MKIIIVILTFAISSCTIGNVGPNYDLDKLMINSLRGKNIGVVESTIFNILSNHLIYDMPVGNDVIKELERLEKYGSEKTTRRKAKITLGYFKGVNSKIASLIRNQFYDRELLFTIVERSLN